jgi:hypothetical protein
MSSLIRPGFRMEWHRTRFHSRELVAAVGHVLAAQLQKLGAYIRRTAKGSIRKAKKPSKPGNPPHGHGDELLKNRIMFDWDPGTRSMVIGPEKTNQIFFDGNGSPVRGTVPHVLEYGGDIWVLEAFNTHAQKWYRADLRSKRRLATKKTRLRKVHVEARPYMGPAFEANQQGVSGLFANSLTLSRAA